MDTRNELRAALTYALQRIDNGVDVRTVAIGAQDAAADIEAACIRERHEPLSNYEQAIMTLQDSLDGVRQSANLRDELNEIIEYLTEIRDDETEAQDGGERGGYTEYDRLQTWANDLQRLAGTVGDATVSADDLTARLTDAAEMDTRFGLRTAPLSWLIRACADCVDMESKKLKNRLEPARTA